MIPWLPQAPIFPPIESALEEPNGLLAAGGDLSPARLLAAYQRGIFPWFALGDPVLWWCPNPRMVLFPELLKIRPSLSKVLRNSAYEVRLDTAFARVVQSCAETPRQGQNGTWITPEMQTAYLDLHCQGYAHSVETWIDGCLVGGLYGIAIGRVFYGESMFSHRKDASKIALAHLCHFLHERDFGIIDCQMETSHLSSLGAAPISRVEFLKRLDALTPLAPRQLPSVGPWPAHAVTDVFRRS